MDLLLKVKDSKVEFLLELLKNFPFVKARQISPAKMKVMDEITEAVKNVNLAKKGKLKAKPIKELLQ